MLVYQRVYYILYLCLYFFIGKSTILEINWEYVLFFTLPTQHPRLPDGTRPVNYLWLPSHDAVAADEALAPLSHLRAEPLHALAEAMCRGKALGLKVASKRGDALFMDVMNTEGREVKADWRLWHAGCSPLEPDQRLTAQIFLETDTNSSNLECCDSKGGTCAESCRSQKMTSSN